MNNNINSTTQWNAENTHPELINSIKDTLRQVVDPEIGLNVIELGLIRNVEINSDSALVTMIMTTPFCPYAPALIEMTRQKAESALKIPTKIILGVEMWDPSMMEDGTGFDWGLY